MPGHRCSVLKRHMQPQNLLLSSKWFLLHKLGLGLEAIVRLCAPICKRKGHDMSCCGGARSQTVLVFSLPPILVRLVQPASSAGVSRGRLRESALSASMCGCCRLWRLGLLEYIPLWSTAAPPPPAIIIFTELQIKKNALFPLKHPLNTNTQATHTRAHTHSAFSTTSIPR